MKRKKEFIIILASIVVIILSVSVAYFTTKITSKNRKVTVTSSELKMVFTSGTGQINSSSITPGWTSGENTFTITNESKKEYTYNLIIKDYINTTVTTGFLVYKITSTDGGYNMTDFIDMPKSSVVANTTLAENIPISAKATHTYKIEIKYLDSPTVSQDEDQGKKLSGTIFIDGVKEASSQNPTPTLASKLLQDNPTIGTRSDFNTPFTTNTANTLYKATENGTDVYYFAGIENSREANCIYWDADNAILISSLDNDGTNRLMYFNSAEEYNNYIEDVGNVSPIVSSKEKCLQNDICQIDSDFVLGLSEDDCNSVGGYYNSGITDYISWVPNKIKINNWVKLGNYYWRIIRTNADGSIRLLYSGTSPDTTEGYIGISKFNENQDSPKYAGYMYGDTDATLEEARTNTNDSTIKTYIDNWYKNNLTTYTNYLSNDAIYCNDRELASGSNYSSFSFNFKLYERLDGDNGINVTPTYDCPNSKDGFSGNNIEAKLKYPIALMTTDEIAYVGGVHGQSALMWYSTNSTNNNITSSNSWWLSSPEALMERRAVVWSVEWGNFPGVLTPLEVASSLAIRPVISLKSCVQWKSGDGSAESPYEIVENGGC